MSGTVWAKYYWADWLSDPGLMRSSLAAQGLWARMLAIAALNDPPGYLSIRGVAMTSEEIAATVGKPPSEVIPLVTELERNGVFSRDRKEIIYSRRIVRDEKKAKTARENGKNGGNPSIRKIKQIPASVNQNSGEQEIFRLDPARARARDHKPIANSQKPEDISSSPSPVMTGRALEDRLRDAAGWQNEPAPKLAITGPIQALLDQGADFDLDVAPTVAAFADKVRSRTSWNYFVNPIREAWEARIAAAKPINGTHQPQTNGARHGRNHTLRERIADARTLAFGENPEVDGSRIGGEQNPRKLP